MRDRGRIFYCKRKNQVIKPNMHVKKFLKYLEKLNATEKHFFNMAMSVIFREALFPEQFDVEEDTVDLATIAKEIDEEIFNVLYPCALEFFFSNEYEMDSNKAWNIIDIFVAKKHKTLEHKEIEYLQALRNSYMGVYEVVTIEVDKCITLRDIIDSKAAPIIVREKKATHCLAKWDLIGARIVTLADFNVLAGGALILTREAAEKATAEISMITEIMMSPSSLHRFKKMGVINPELMIKKMWAKEIIGQWFHTTIEKFKPKTFYNTDGHKINPYTLEYTLKKPQKEIIEILNNLGELHPFDIEDCKHAWIWVGKKNNKRGVDKGDNALIVETYLTNVDDARQYSIFAELRLYDKKLEVDINSKERANILRNYIEFYLANQVQDPIAMQHNLRSEESHASESATLELSREETQEIVNTFINEHYAKWLDSCLPALDNKTPRQAANNPVSRRKVIDLIKDMSRDRLLKENNYDFRKLFTALGIEEAELN